MGKNAKIVALVAGAVVFFGIAFLIGFFVYPLINPQVSNNGLAPLSNNQKPPENQNQSFDTITASSTGMVLEASDGKVKVSKNNQVNTYPLARDFVVYNFAPGSKLASASSDIKKIPTNKEAQMVFEQKDGIYELKVITVLPASK